jgi:undecaprenyl-diphosphatase
MKEALHKLPHDIFLTLMFGTLISGLVGYLSIWFLLRYLRTHTTGIFIAYRIIVGGAILIALFMGKLSAL